MFSNLLLNYTITKCITTEPDQNPNEIDGRTSTDVTSSYQPLAHVSWLTFNKEYEILPFKKIVFR